MTHKPGCKLGQPADGVFLGRLMSCTCYDMPEATPFVDGPYKEAGLIINPRERATLEAMGVDTSWMNVTKDLVTEPMPDQEPKPGCTCTATHEGPCNCGAWIGNLGTPETLWCHRFCSNACSKSRANCDDSCEKRKENKRMTNHEGSCQDSRAETPETPGEECCKNCADIKSYSEDIGSFLGCKNLYCHCHTPTLRAETLEERFDAEFPELNDFPDLGDEIKSFIASEIQSAVEEERRRIAARVRNGTDYGFCCSACQSRILERISDIINPK